VSKVKALARANPGDVERLLINTATQDGKRVEVGFGQDPGRAGKSQALHLVRALSASLCAGRRRVATS
jgi:phage terminase large subunit-like protein